MWVETEVLWEDVPTAELEFSNEDMQLMVDKLVCVICDATVQVRPPQVSMGC